MADYNSYPDSPCHTPLNESKRDRHAHDNDTCSWGSNLILFRFLFVMMVLLSINVVFFIPDWTHNYVVGLTFNTSHYNSSQCSLGDPYASNSCFEKLTFFEDNSTFCSLLSLDARVPFKVSCRSPRTGTILGWCILTASLVFVLFSLFFLVFSLKSKKPTIEKPANILQQAVLFVLLLVGSILQARYFILDSHIRSLFLVSATISGLVLICQFVLALSTMDNNKRFGTFFELNMDVKKLLVGQLLIIVFLGCLIPMVTLTGQYQYGKNVTAFLPDGVCHFSSLGQDCTDEICEALILNPDYQPSFQGPCLDQPLWKESAWVETSMIVVIIFIAVLVYVRSIYHIVCHMRDELVYPAFFKKGPSWKLYYLQGVFFKVVLIVMGLSLHSTLLSKMESRTGQKRLLLIEVLHILLLTLVCITMELMLMRSYENQLHFVRS